MSICTMSYPSARIGAKNALKSSGLTAAVLGRVPFRRYSAYSSAEVYCPSSGKTRSPLWMVSGMVRIWKRSRSWGVRSQVLS